MLESDNKFLPVQDSFPFRRLYRFVGNHDSLTIESFAFHELNDSSFPVHFP